MGSGKISPTTLRACLAAVAIAGVATLASAQPVNKPTIDGNLNDLEAIVAQVLSGDLAACAVNQIDNIGNGLSPGQPNPDGFQDEPLQDDATPQFRFMHSPINVGNALFLYKPDSDGVVDPNNAATDDSFLAVGINIANGKNLAGGAISDIFDDSNKAMTAPDLPNNPMVPFDADGNGNPAVLGVGAASRWFPLAPVLTFAEANDAINLDFYLCLDDPSQFSLRIPDFQIIYQQQFAGNTLLRVFRDGVEVPAGNIPTVFPVQLFPPNNSDAASIAARGVDNIDNDDFEFLIDKIDSKVMLIVGDTAADYLSKTRFRMAALGLSIRSDASGDLSNEDSMFLLCQEVIPGIEVKKEVRCFGTGGSTAEGPGGRRNPDLQGEVPIVEDTGPGDEEPDRGGGLSRGGKAGSGYEEAGPTFASSTTALPGSTVEFRITVCNTGNQALAVTLDDLIQGFSGATLAPVAGSMDVQLFRPGNSGIPIPLNFGNAALQDPQFNPSFFNPDGNAFLNAMTTGTPLCLGVLNGAGCDPSTGNLVAGDKVIITFRAVVNHPTPANLCSNRLTVDAENCVTAIGDPDFLNGGPCPSGPADGDEVVDTEKVVDTPAEQIAGADDNCATVNLLCRSVDLTKCVALVQGGQVTGPCKTGDDSLDLPNAFPLTIEYQFKVTNNGEVAEAVTLTEGEFCADIAATAGVSIVLDDCGLCPTGQVAFNLPLDNPGTPAVKENEKLCKVRVQFANGAALANFLNRDNGRANCNADAIGSTPAECYRNCAAISATANNLGDACAPNPIPPLIDTGSAVICNRQCEVEVIKRVRCLPTGNPNESTATNPFVDGANLKVVPGATVEYEITITNQGDIPICELEITDNMTNQAAFAAGSLPGNKSCTNAPCGNGLFCANFNVNNVPVVCPGNLAAGASIVIRFTGVIANNANPANDPVNTVTVRGKSTCPSTTFDCTDTDTESLDVVPASVICVGKDWAFLQDANGDCTPDGSFGANPVFSKVLDLSDKQFPVLLRLRIRAQNTGQVPLNITAKDDALRNCVNVLPGVAFQGNCDIDPADPDQTQENVAAGATATWLCDIRVDTAEAMRALAACDGINDNACDNDPARDLCYFNTAVITAVAATTTGFCVPNNPPVLNGTGDCSATLKAPPPCSFDISKKVICIDCNTGATIGNLEDKIDAAPGACARFVVTITNTSTKVKIPRLCIDDDLSRKDFFQAGTVTATITPGNINVLGCFGNFDDGILDGLEKCYTFAACRPATPWIAPGETLTLTFNIKIDPNFNVAGQMVDVLNSIRVKAFTEVCAPSPDAPCGESTADAEINVRVPKVECLKTVRVNGGAPSSSVNITMPTYPVDLRYEYTIRNTGEVPLANATICDNQLVADAIAASIQILSCDLCDAVCDGVGDTCKNLGAIAPLGSATAACTIRINSADEWELFALSDNDGRDNCYVNRASATATPDFTGLCSFGQATAVTSPDCTAEVCIDTPVCPPIVKAVFDVYNENEDQFSGMEACINSWQCRRLSDWIPFGFPNYFLREFLQTDKGKARIDGIGSNVVCGEDSIDAPLLGVAAKIVEYANSDIERAGLNLGIAGQQVGVIYATVNDGPGEGGTVSSATTQPSRAHATKKGSLLIFPKIEIKWDAAGNVIQDTYLDLTNDYPANVLVQMWLVNGDPGRCNAVDFRTELTMNEPCYWSARTGLPKAVTPFSVLDPPRGRPDSDPRNPGGTILSGYLIAYAVNGNEQEIKWDHLKGEALIINFKDGTAWEYNAWAFQAVAGRTIGDTLVAPFGKLDLDGAEYDYAPDTLLFDFYTPGTILRSNDTTAATITDTELTLWAVWVDLTAK